MTNPILQFGTSRFLQAHADLFVHQARQGGQDIGPITVVKTTAGTDRAGRLLHLARPEGYPVHIRGLRNGQPVDETVTVTSIAAALSAQDDWPAVVRAFCACKIVISNVGDSGYEIAANDRALHHMAPGIPASFPGKLLALLLARHDAGKATPLILPCELIAHNGVVLRDILVPLAQDWQAPAAFLDWLDGAVICDTLVDRIVPAELQPVGAIAEPYALWAIQIAPGGLPFRHPDIIETLDLEPYLRLKLHILNLGHTFLAQHWLAGRRPADETVRQILSDPPMRAALLDLYQAEIIPGFAARGMGPAAEAYVHETMDRFENPYLAHPLRDIAQNHAIKIERRATAFIDWAHGVAPDLPLPTLRGLSDRAS